MPRSLCIITNNVGFWLSRNHIKRGWRTKQASCFNGCVLWSLCIKCWAQKERIRNQDKGIRAHEEVRYKNGPSLFVTYLFILDSPQPNENPMNECSSQFSVTRLDSKKIFCEKNRTEIEIKQREPLNLWQTRKTNRMWSRIKTSSRHVGFGIDRLCCDKGHSYANSIDINSTETKLIIAFVKERITGVSLSFQSFANYDDRWI